METESYCCDGNTTLKHTLVLSGNYGCFCPTTGRPQDDIISFGCHTKLSPKPTLTIGEVHTCRLNFKSKRVDLLLLRKPTWEKKWVHNGLAMQNTAQSALIYQICPSVEGEDMRSPRSGNPTKVAVPGKQVETRLPCRLVNTHILDGKSLIY